MQFQRVIVIGLGLIGGSIARALREKNHSIIIIAVDANQESLAYAEKCKLIDRGYHHEIPPLQPKDLVIIAVPCNQLSMILTSIKPQLSPDIVVTDIISVKGEVQKIITQIFGEVPNNFILGHPLAGSEKRGVQSADAKMFIRKKVILTPLKNVNSAMLKAVQEFWQYLGAEILLTDVAKHDLLLAGTSHLPHLLAYCLLDTLLQFAGEEISDFAGSGLRDTTRIAGSNPVLWSDILLANKNNMLTVIDAFSKQLQRLRQDIAEENETALINMFTLAKLLRQKLGE